MLESFWWRGAVQRLACAMLPHPHAPSRMVWHHCAQGQASDILIQAREIERLRDLLVSLYVRHCGQNTETVGELMPARVPGARHTRQLVVGVCCGVF
jgi:hypothetical protein